MAYHKRNTKQDDSDLKTVTVTETREITLPDLPAIPTGKVGFRMIYKTGECRDIVGESRFDCTGQAIKQAGLDKMNFRSDDIISFNQIKGK